MSPTSTLAQALRVQPVGNVLKVDAPWRQAEGLQTFLRRRGIGTTLVLDARPREAHLEVWPGADATTVQQALDAWIAHH
jgi:hypothetical protein